MKNLLFFLIIIAALKSQAQELDKHGYKFVEKAFYTFIDEGNEQLKEFYIPLKQHNELLSIRRGNELEKAKHNEIISNYISRSMLSLKDIGNLTEKDIMVREINMGDSYDEEGIIFMNIEVVGSDGEKHYVMIINDFIQYDIKEYYLTKPLAIEVKNPE